jgi:hypothetical protein
MADMPKVLVTERADAPPDGTVVATPAGVPDFQVVVVPGLVRALVRSARTYIQVLIAGLVGVAVPAAGMLPDPLPPMDAGTKIVAVAGAALLPAFVSLLWNVAELLAKLDESAPELRG